MANTRFGNFKDLVKDQKEYDKNVRKGMKALTDFAVDLTPAPELSKVFGQKGYGPVDAMYDLQNKYVPFANSYNKWLRGEEVEPEELLVDAVLVGAPWAKTGARAVKNAAKKTAETIEKIPKGGKEGFIDFTRISNERRNVNPTSAAKGKGVNVEQFLKNNGRVIQKPKDWEKLGEEGRARYLVKELQSGKFFPHTTQGEMYYKTHPSILDAQDYAEFMNYIEHRPELAMNLASGDFNSEAFNRFVAGEPFEYSKQAITNVDPTYANAKSLLEKDKIEQQQREYAAELANAKKAEKDAAIAEKKLKEQQKWAEKEAKWKAEREAAAKLAEEKRLAKEAEQQRLAAEAEQKRLAEEAEAKRLADEEARMRAEEERRAAEEAEFERQFREEEAAERNRYADSVGTALGREMAERDVDNWLFDKLVEEESKKNNPVSTMDVFTGESFGGTPTVGSTNVKSTKTRPTYDHSREFNGGNFQRLDPINRGTLKGNGDLGERMFDAQSKFYTPAANPGERINSMSTGRRFDEGFPISPTRDPYNEAGVINDLNVKLNNIIDMERKRGLSDAEIYRKHKPEFDEYQGKLERYNYRLNNPSSTFNYDGALTNSIVATPSEEINVLRNLGLAGNVDKRMGNIYDDVRDHYKSLMERIFDYESKFPQSPKLSNEQLVRLKDMGVKPEEIDIFLAEHPEFMLQ